MPTNYFTDYIQYHVYLVSNIKMIKADSKQQNPKKKKKGRAWIQQMRQHRGEQTGGKGEN